MEEGLLMEKVFLFWWSGAMIKGDRLVASGQSEICFVSGLERDCLMVSMLSLILYGLFD